MRKPMEDPIASYRETIRLLLAAWDRQSDDPAFNQQPRDASQMTRLGLYTLQAGMPSTSRQCFERALPQLLEDLGPNGPPETLAAVMLAPVQQPLPQIEGVQVEGATVTWGWTALQKSEWWHSVAICRWMLHSQDDPSSLHNASEMIHAYYADPRNAEEARHPSAMDGACLLFVAAGHDRRCRDYLEASGKFRPPAKPGAVRTPRAMAWALASHRLERAWSAGQLDSAWESFLKTCVPKLRDGGMVQELALWLKMRFWDGAKPVPSPHEVYLRQFAYLPQEQPPTLIE